MRGSSGNLSRIASVMHDAAERGGGVIRRAFPQPSSDAMATTRSKGTHSYNLVTETDEESEREIVDAIRSAFPDHAILAEEQHATTSIDAEHLWIVDPLDGTNNFAHGIPHSAVSIAYRRAGTTLLAVVHNPLTGDWYHAERGCGATWNGHAIRVSPARSLREILVGVGFYYDRGAMMRGTLEAIAALFAREIHGIRRFGTASLDLCQVAAGRFGAFFEYELAPWDFAAGALIVAESGGRVSDVSGNTLPVARSTVLAAAPGVYEAVREIVAPYAPQVD